MAEVLVRIGSMEDVHAYDDGDYDSAVETTAPLKAGAPVDPNDVVILGGGGAGSITPLSVADIDDPSAELNALAGVLGSFVLCFEVEAATNQFTIYAFDASDTGGEDVPYTVDALTSGLWVAVAGKYSESRVNWQKITANGITPGGGLGGGDVTGAVAFLQSSHDGNEVQVDEIAGNAGQYLEIDFANVTAFNLVRVRIRAQEQGGHALTIQLEITPFAGAVWHDYDVIVDQAADINYEDHSFFVVSDTPYINGGVVKLRITHEMAGNAVDEWHIDEVALYR